MSNARGNALILVIVLMASVGLAGSAFYINQTTTATTGGSLFAHKRAFYAAEGTLLIAIKVAQAYLSETITPTAPELKSRLERDLPGLVSSEYVVEDIAVEIDGVPFTGPITTGTFRGMLAPQTTVKLSYNVKSEADTLTRSVVGMSATMLLAQVSMFQFLYFIDLVYADFSPGPIMRLNGRVHANGDLCLSGALGIYLAQVTSAGRLMYGNNSRCKYRKVGTETYIASGPNNTLPVRLTNSNSNGCTNCGGTRMPWADYAPAIWNGNAMDAVHGVTDMVLPVPSGVITQMGADGDDRWIGMANNRNLRFVVDPLRPGDSEQIAKQKFAYKSDIRIISGVWYLRDNASGTSWPGIPIWSDHPGHFVDAWTNPVGQDDLRARWSAVNPWPAGATPRQFSYYEYDVAAGSVRNDATGVVSYGNLFTGASGGKTKWSPGHWLSSPEGDRICPTGSVLLTPAGVADAFAPLNCSSTGSPSPATALLNATRGGIHDGHIRRLYPVSGERLRRAKVLPLNFDIEQFQRALLNTGPGELGSYFGAGRFMGARFNGVVYITNTWPGSDGGFTPSDAPTAAPMQGVQSDVNQVDITTGPSPLAAIPATGGTQQRALPFNLCSSDLNGRPYDQYDNGGTPVIKFRVPNCASYPGIQAYPTAIRIINGYALDPAQLEKGLSIVSNIGVYIQGEFNTLSQTADETSLPWKPALVAADQINFLSNSWNDANSSWIDDAHTASRTASETEYNLAILTGWARSRNSMTLHAFPSMMEDWRTATIKFNGSIVIGYYPVYERYGKFYDTAGYTYRAGLREINYDKHLQYTANQPPGAPLFYISSLVDWKAE